MRFISIFLLTLSTFCYASDLKKHFPIKCLNDILELKNTLRPETDCNEAVLAEIEQIEIFRDHYILVDPHEAKKANIFTKHSRYKKTLNKYGEGPGEFQRPSFIVCTPNEIHMFGFYPSKRLIFDQNLQLINETRTGIKIVELFTDYCNYYKGNYVFWGRNLEKHPEKIVVTDLSFNHKMKFRKVEELNRFISWNYVRSTVVKDTLWVTRMFDPYVDIFDLKTGKLIKTLGKNLKRPASCLYNHMIGKMKKEDQAHNFKTLFKGIAGTYSCCTLTNIEDKIVIYGAFIKKDSKGRKHQFFDIYDSEGNLLQQEVLLKQDRAKNQWFYKIPTTSSGKLFLIDTNIAEEDEEDFCAVIYEYGMKGF